MKFSAILALTAAVSSAIDIEDLDFMNYLSKYGKQYESVKEYIMRKEIYLSNALKIA